MIEAIIVWIVLGAIAGWIASMITRSHNSLGADIIVGILGAVIGGWIMNLLGAGAATGFNPYSLVVAVVGAVVLLLIVKMVRRTA